MHFCIGFFIIFDKNLFKMKNITFILPAWDAVKNVPFELHKDIELEAKRAEEAIRLGVAEEVKDVKTVLHTIVFYDEIIGVE